MIADKFEHDGDTYTFIPPRENLAYTQLKQTMPIGALHTGDFDMDGYPDVLAILRKKGT